VSECHQSLVVIKKKNSRIICLGRSFDLLMDLEDDAPRDSLLTSFVLGFRHKSVSVLLGVGFLSLRVGRNVVTVFCCRRWHVGLLSTYIDYLSRNLVCRECTRESRS
jgi:hypothetical protein